VLALDPDPQPAPPVAPVLALCVEVGLGKTRTWRERVALALAGTTHTVVPAVPRHRLGDEIVHDLAEAGITARVYRGREANDPEQPGEKMCRELERAALITDALGAVAPRRASTRIRSATSTRSAGISGSAGNAPTSGLFRITSCSENGRVSFRSRTVS